MSEHPSPPVVLVATPDSSTASSLDAALQSGYFRVERVMDGRAAVTRIEQRPVDLVLLDASIPPVDGVACCRMLKTISREVFLPVILLLSRSGQDAPSVGVRVGADDHLPVPVDAEVLVARVEDLIELKRGHEELDRLRRRVDEASRRDRSTGFYRFRQVQDRLATEFKRAESALDPLACAICVIDGAEEQAARLGQLAFEQALAEVAARSREALPPNAQGIRYGGDSFLFLLPHTQFATGVASAERFRSAIEATPFETTAGSVVLSVSLGLAFYPSRDVRTPEKLLRGAESALVQATTGGRNRVCVYHHPGFVHRPEGTP